MTNPGKRRHLYAHNRHTPDRQITSEYNMAYLKFGVFLIKLPIQHFPAIWYSVCSGCGFAHFGTQQLFTGELIFDFEERQTYSA